jgi:CHAT domain-containing protein/Tfp pilus assembly protein PilF
MTLTTLATAGILSVALLDAGVRAEQEATVLEPGQPIERQLARGEEHSYRLALTAGEYAHVVVEQHGIDIVVQTRGGDASTAVDIQEAIGRLGDEQVDVVADTTGTYDLAIRPAPGVIEPGSYTIRVVGRRAATDADRSMQEARTLRAAASRLEQAAKFDEARAMFERSLSMTEAARGPDDPFAGIVLFDLGGNALERRDDAAAQACYQRAIAVLDKAWGAGHPYPAMARSRLALAQRRAGQGPKAEALLQQAIDALEKTLPPEHPWVVRSLMTLATFRSDAADLDKAEDIYRRLLAAMDKAEDTASLLYADLLNNLGDVYRQKQDFPRAESLFQRSLAIGERLRGPDSYYVSNALQNLGIIARERKDYAGAQRYYAQALSIRERLVGADHPDSAQILNNLANIQHATGDDVAAVQTYLRALHIWEQAFGPYHRGTLTAVGNIARTYASAGDLPNAIRFQRRADAIIETQIALNLAVGSERQKLAFVRGAAERTDRTLSLNLVEAPADPDASALAATVVLQRKGRVLDAMIDTFAAVSQRIGDPRDRDLFDQLRTTTAQLAKLALTPPPEAGNADERHRSIDALEARKERLEAELSEHSAEFRVRAEPVTLDAVQAAVPDDAALVEFAMFHPFDPKAERNAEAYGPARYAAYVVRAHEPPRGHDLGPAKAIDDAIAALRAALSDPSRRDVQPRARLVDELVMRPLRASFGGAARLLISPDGDLNLVPVEALVDERGRYLIERYAIGYLTSGRDLLRMKVARANRSAPVIIADPAYGEPSVAAAAAAQPAPRRVAANTARRNVTIRDDRSALYFAPLANTAAEARAIKALFPEAALFTGSRATKSVLAGLEGPRILHIASHGFFLDAGASPSVPSSPVENGDTRGPRARLDVENPLLRSGLALAGANLAHDTRDDGILTALEASGLNLRGTKLVTLSACDTGVGEVRGGEGAYGLRRAFVLAGAETLVMSLWPVSDYVTRETMTAYYTGLHAGLGRGDSLRQTKLALLKRKGRQHPFYWASFIQAGEWASLDGAR